MAVATKSKEKVIELLPIQIEEFEVQILGVSPLIVHRFSEKAKRQIEEKQQKKAKQAKEARDPHAEFLASLYVMPGSVAGEEGAEYGIKAVWFKLAAVSACRYSDGLKMTNVRGSFHVMADAGDLVKLTYSDLEMRSDPVTIGMGSRDMRYRGQFNNWSCKLRVRYNAAAITPEQIVNLLQAGGFGCGIGERRPSQQCSDQFGMFEVALTK